MKIHCTAQSVKKGELIISMRTPLSRTVSTVDTLSQKKTFENPLFKKMMEKVV
jgi:hypothetical protein